MRRNVDARCAHVDGVRHGFESRAAFVTGCPRCHADRAGSRRREGGGRDRATCRELFPVTRRVAYLNTASVGLASTRLSEAYARLLETWTADGFDYVRGEAAVGPSCAPLRQGSVVAEPSGCDRPVS